MTSGKLREILINIVARIIAEDMTRASDMPREPHATAIEIIEVIETLGYLKGMGR